MSQALIALFAGCLFGAPVAAGPLGPGPKETPRDRAKAMVEEFEKYYDNPNEHVRKAAVMGLAECDHELAVEPLLKAVVDESVTVRRQAEVGLASQATYQAHHRLIDALRDTKDLELTIAILGAFKTSKPKSAYDTLLKYAAHKVPAVRAIAAEVLGVLEAPGHQTEAALTGLLSDKEAEVRFAALDSLALQKSPQLLVHSFRLLETDPEWRVRATCIATLKKARLAESIQPLIAAFQREDGRLEDDCHDALVEITGEINIDPLPEKWQEWWDRVHARFTVPALAEIEKRRAPAKIDPKYAKGKKEYAPFVGIPTRSKRMLFILDVSNSMQDRLTLESTDPERVKLFRERYGGYDTKIDLSREELINTIATLEDHVRFNIVLFHTFVEKWKDGLQPATTANRNAAIKFLTRLTTSFVDGIAKQSKDNGRTNSFDALNVAFGVGNEQKPQASKLHTVESDTVFFVTDGMPTAGRITDPEELIRYFLAANRRARMVFHVITFAHGNEALLKTIAEHSGGKYLVIAIE